MPNTSPPLITVAVPSFNQGRFLERTLESIFEQDVPVEVFILDGGSTDNSLDIIKKWESRLAGWRSHKDNGQAAAINEGITQGRADYVCWLNSDDWLLPGGLLRLFTELQQQDTPFTYGRCWNFVEKSSRKFPVWVEAFSERRMALRNVIAQPATLIRRKAWEAIGGLDPSLHMAMDYDLWWRLYKKFGTPHFVNDFIAINRMHDQTKTRTQRFRHYREAIDVVRKHHGRVPLKWWLAQPYAVWFQTLTA